MFTSKQEKAIFNFLDANQKVLQTFYKDLLEKGIHTDENGNIIIESNEITRSLLCNEDYI